MAFVTLRMLLGALLLWTSGISVACADEADADFGVEQTDRVSENEFRLSEGIDPSEGYLHMYSEIDHKPWSRVCTGSVNSAVAYALCLRLGYRLACDFHLADKKGQEAMRMSGTTTTDVDFAGCSWSHGADSVDCFFTARFNNKTACENGSEVWLRCASDDTILELSLLLEDPNFANAGTLLARCRGVEAWSNVCGTNHWDTRDGEVVCRQLGFPTLASMGFRTVKEVPAPAMTLRNQRQHNEADRRVIVSDIGCQGTEENLLNCSLVAYGECQRAAYISCGTETSKYDPPVGLCGARDTCGEYCSQTVLGDSRNGCQCDPLCEAFGDCCYDYHLSCRSPADPTLPSMVQLNGVDIKYYKCIKTGSMDHAFDLVALCPPGAGALIRHLCESARPADRPIANGFVPAYDRAGVHYRNIYCAVCHGLRAWDVELWTINVTHKREINKTFDTNVGTKLPGIFVTVSVMPPAHVRDTARPCLNADYINTCLPEYNGTELERACQEFAAPVDLSTGLYRNSYCAMCNGQSHGDLGYHCEDSIQCLECTLTDPWSTCNGACWQKPHVRSFLTIEVLFKFRRLDDPKESCFPNEQYFPLLQACREVGCLSDSPTLDGVCSWDSPAQPTCFSQLALRGNPFAYNESNPINLELAPCLESIVGLATDHVEFWEAEHLNINPKVEYSINILVSDYESTQKICKLLIDNDADSVCKISRASVFIEDPEEVLEIDMCLNYTVPASEIFPELCQEQEGASLVLGSKYITSATNEIAIPRVCIQHNLTCTFGSTLEPSEFRIYTVENRSILEHRTSKMVLYEDEYVLLPDSRAYVCLYPTDIQSVGESTSYVVRQYISLFLSVLSLVALLGTLLTYCLLPTLRNFAGRCIINLVVALFVANLALMISGFASGTPWLCLGVALLAHLTWLATFHWLTVLSINVAFTFGHGLINRGILSSGKVGSPNSHRLLYCMVFAWGAPVVIVGTCLILHLCDCTSVPPVYAVDGYCYISNRKVALYAFGIPVAVLVMANAVSFVYTVVNLRRQKASTSATTQKIGKGKNGSTKEFKIYCRLVVLMGLAWIFGFLTNIVPGEVILYVHAVLNSLNGCLIFICLCLTKNVRRLWKERLRETQLFKTQTSVGPVVKKAWQGNTEETIS